MMVDVYTKRLQILKNYGFTERRGCITNGKYAFLYHQLDKSYMTDEQFIDFIKELKQE